MITYKDQTFCNFHADCMDAKTCDRAWTEKEKEESQKWWSIFKNTDYGPPVSFYANKPSCHNPIKK